MITNKDIRLECSNLIINGEKHPLDPAVEALTKRANIVQGKFSALDTKLDAIEALEKTASGNPISITGAAGAYAISNLMTIEPIQSGSGDPSPTNVRPISGLTEVKVARTGKNIAHIDSTKIYSTDKNPSEPITGIADGMLILSAAANGYIRGVHVASYKINNANSITVKMANTAGSGVYGVGIVVEIDDTKTYTLNLSKTGGDATVGWLNSDGSSLSYTARWDIPITLAPPSGAKYAMILCCPGRNTEHTFSDIQFEEGATATPYEPYTAATASITLGQTVYGGSVNFKTGEVTVTHKCTTVGDMSWSYESASTRFGADLSDMKYAESLTTLPPLRCSAYKPLDITTFNTGVNNAIRSNDGGSKSVWIRDTRYTDATAFKTAMASTVICYELATPTTLTLTPAELELLKGNNTVSGNGANINLTYIGR